MPFTPGFLAAYGDRDFRITAPQGLPHAPYLGGAGVSIRLTAITAVQARALNSSALTATLLEEVHTFAEKVVAELKKYPPPVHNTHSYIRKAASQSVAAGTSSWLPQSVEWPRSYNLQRHWQIRPYRRGDAQGYDIVNDAREGQRGIKYNQRAHAGALNRYYARYVQGPPHTHTYNTGEGGGEPGWEFGGQQTWFHGKNGWTTTVEALQEQGGRKELKEILQDVINDHLAATGLTAVARK